MADYDQFLAHAIEMAKKFGKPYAVLSYGNPDNPVYAVLRATCRVDEFIGRVHAVVNADGSLRDDT